MSAPYRVFAVQYARSMRPAHEYYMGHDPHDGPAPIFYYVWLLMSAQRTILVDTGFNADRAAARRRDFLRCPTEGLRTLGVAPTSIDTVILTHLHYDHAGNLDLFPAARFVLQDAEMRHVTGRAMRHRLLRAPFELEDVLAAVTHVHAGRIDFIDGVGQVAPGVMVHPVPGHSPGLQAVTVETARGRLCLASDAAHFMANITEGAPFPITVDLGAHLEGHDTVLRLAGAWDRLVPGHDPAVAALWPAVPGDPLTFEVSASPRAPLPPAPRIPPG